MKSFLAFLVAMGIIVTLGDASCRTEFQISGELYRGCRWHGKLYPLGPIERTEDCYRCTCSKTYMHCCTIFGTFVSYDKKKCKILINKKRCDYEVVDKNDPSKACITSKPLIGVL